MSLYLVHLVPAFFCSPDCWSPPEFKASYERYAETVCFINGSYFISINQYEVPVDDGRYSHRIRYYQWTPFILLLQA